MPRGNSHWGVNSGDFGKIQMLPMPSLFAGALRSCLAVKDQTSFQEVKQGLKPQNEVYAKVLGSLKEPGSFRIKNICLGKRKVNGFESIYSMPSDINLFENDEVKISRPVILPDIIKKQTLLPMVAALKASSKKPASKCFLTSKGFDKYINGEGISSEDLVKIKDLWETEMRIGLALDSNTRAAREGYLYSAETLTFKEDVGFIVEVEGADELLPQKGTLSLGGDQRAADFEIMEVKKPNLDISKIEQERKFKLILSGPAIFANGWLPDLVNKKDEDYILSYKGCSARLVCASVNGYETVSGWNMVTNAPKTALKSVLAGSVYWFDSFTGSITDLYDLVDAGWWHENADKQRVVEGYNRVVLASY